MTVQLEKVVQWYPGHMAAAMRRLGEYVKLADIVVEVADARIPRTGRNPMLDALIGKRARVLALSREDLAQPRVTKAWIAAFAREGLEAAAFDGRSQRSVARIGALLSRLVPPTGGIARVLVVGVPNSAKSCAINGLLRRAAAKTEDRAGVTRQLQWFRLSNRVELMDTPGILVPKIADSGGAMEARDMRRASARTVRPRARGRRILPLGRARTPTREGSRPSELCRRARRLASRRFGQLPQRCRILHSRV